METFATFQGSGPALPVLFCIHEFFPSRKSVAQQISTLLVKRRGLCHPKQCSHISIFILRWEFKISVWSWKASCSSPRISFCARLNFCCQSSVLGLPVLLEKKKRQKTNTHTPSNPNQPEKKNQQTKAPVPIYEYGTLKVLSNFFSK